MGDALMAKIPAPEAPEEQQIYLKRAVTQALDPAISPSRGRSPDSNDSGEEFYPHQSWVLMKNQSPAKLPRQHTAIKAEPVELVPQSYESEAQSMPRKEIMQV